MGLLHDIQIKIMIKIFNSHIFRSLEQVFDEPFWPQSVVPEKLK